MRVEIARQATNAAIPIGVIGASLPPAIIAVAQPRRIVSAASPIAWAAVAQAEVGPMAAPGKYSVKLTVDGQSLTFSLVAVVSSSANTRDVLEITGLDRFDAWRNADHSPAVPDDAGVTDAGLRAQIRDLFRRQPARH